MCKKGNKIPKKKNKSKKGIKVRKGNKSLKRNKSLNRKGEIKVQIEIGKSKLVLKKKKKKSFLRSQFKIAIKIRFLEVDSELKKSTQACLIR